MAATPPPLPMPVNTASATLWQDVLDNPILLAALGAVAALIVIAVAKHGALKKRRRRA